MCGQYMFAARLAYTPAGEGPQAQGCRHGQQGHGEGYGPAEDHDEHARHAHGEELLVEQKNKGNRD